MDTLRNVHRYQLVYAVFSLYQLVYAVFFIPVGLCCMFFYASWFVLFSLYQSVYAVFSFCVCVEYDQHYYMFSCWCLYIFFVFCIRERMFVLVLCEI